MNFVVVFEHVLAPGRSAAGGVAFILFNAFFGGGPKPGNCVFSVALQEVFLLGLSLMVGGPLLLLFALGARRTAYSITCVVVLLVSFYLLTQVLDCARDIHERGESFLTALYYLLPGLAIVTGIVVIPSLRILKRRSNGNRS